MRRKSVESELIASLGWKNQVLQVRYQDGTIFDYFGVPFTIYSVLLRSKHPGQEWLEIRDEYRYAQVK